MPALTKSLPKYRKHRASGQAAVRIHGKDHYLGPHGTKASKELYDRLIAEYLSRGRDFGPGQPDCCSVAEVFLAYWKFAQGYYVKNGKPTNELDALRLVIRDARKLYGTVSATDFGPRALKTVREI